MSKVLFFAILPDRHHLESRGSEVEKNVGQNFRDLRVQNILEKLVLQFNSQVFDFPPPWKKRDS